MHRFPRYLLIGRTTRKLEARPPEIVRKRYGVQPDFALGNDRNRMCSAEAQASSLRHRKALQPSDL